MSVGTREPVPLFGRVLVWGLPLHGLVRAGTITLANGTTQAHGQPLAYADIGDWTGGDTLLVRRPSWVAPVIDPADQAAHIAAGRDFRGYALVSGGWRDIADQPLSLGSWLAFDPAGNCWWWNLTGVSGAESAFVMTVQRRRFGLFDGASYPFSPTATPAFSLGQAGAPALEVRDLDGTTRLLPQTGIAQPYCVSTTGAKSLWMLMAEHYAPEHATGIGSTIRERPIGYIEATTTPTGITASTIRSRAQCMGAVVNVDYGGGQLRVSFVQDAVDTVIGLCPSGANRLETTFTPVFLLDDYAAPAINSYAVPLASSGSGGLSPQIVAMWYDQDGVLHEITIDIAHSHIVTRTASNTTSGTTTWTSDCAGGFVRSGFNRWQRTDSYSVSESCVLTLRDNGAAAVQVVVSRAASASVVLDITRDEFNNAPAGVAQTMSRTDSLSIDGVVVSSATSSGDAYNQTEFSSFIAPAVSAYWTGAAQPYHNERQFSAIPLGVGVVGGARAVIDLVRWCNNAVGFRVQRGTPAAPSVLSRHEFGSAVTPAGVIAHARTDDMPAQSRVRVSGSVEPIQGLFASSVSEDAAGVTHEPVCWV